MPENSYQTKVFQEAVIGRENFQELKSWRLLRDLQFEFLMANGLTKGSVILDIGCGPLRLGGAVIEFLDGGHYFGTDINAEALNLGTQVLQRLGISKSNFTLIASSDFDFGRVDRPVDIAFSNSLFSHLTMNSIRLCLLNLRPKLKPGASYFSTFFSLAESERIEQAFSWTMNNGLIRTWINRDPYHYYSEDLAWLAKVCGYRMELIPGYGHPVQTMAKFTKS